MSAEIVALERQQQEWERAIACGYLIRHDLLVRTCVVCRFADAEHEDLILGGYVCGPVCYTARWDDL